MILHENLLLQLWLKYGIVIKTWATQIALGEISSESWSTPHLQESLKQVIKLFPSKESEFNSTELKQILNCT